MASGMVRYGFNDWLTIESHAEGGSDLLNGGIGSVFGVGSYGIASLAGAASMHESDSGYQGSASVQTELWGLQLYARTQRTFGTFDDIASISAPASQAEHGIPRFSTRPPTAVDQVSVSMPLGFDPTSLNLSFTQLKTAGQESSRIVGISASRPLGEHGNAFATAYADVDRKNSFGLFVGMSWSFGRDITASTGISSDYNGYSIASNLVKSEGSEVGGTGWRLRDIEGASPNRSASISHHASFARLEAGLQQYGNTARANAQIEGAAVIAGGDIFLTDRVDDAFVVVDAGAPGVDVSFENRPIGKTNRRGKILLPNLRGYQKNQISINPANLPLDATVDSTREIVVPRYRSGSVVDFAVDTATKAALVTLRDDNGDPVEPGATGQIEGHEGGFVVGYDGQAYITGLSRRNHVLVIQPTRGRCTAEFTYQPSPGERILIPNTLCRETP